MIRKAGAIAPIKASDHAGTVYILVLEQRLEVSIVQTSVLPVRIGECGVSLDKEEVTWSNKMTS